MANCYDDAASDDANKALLSKDVDVSLSICQLVSPALPRLLSVAPDAERSAKFHAETPASRHAEERTSEYPWTPAPIPQESARDSFRPLDETVPGVKLVHIASAKAAGINVQHRGRDLSWVCHDLHIREPLIDILRRP